MKLFTCLILLLSTLLVGCKEKLATLIFSSKSIQDGEVISVASRYSNESRLARAFEKMGIVPGVLEIERDSDDPLVVRLLAPEDALDARQKEMIKSYLKGIMAAREQPAFKMALTARKADFDDTLPAAYVDAALKPVVFVMSNYTRINALHPQSYMPYTPGDKSPTLLCAMQVALAHPGWLAYNRLERIEGAMFDSRGTPNMQAELRMPQPAGPDRKVQVGTTLTVDNADLRQLLNAGKVRLHMHIQPRPLSMPKVAYGEVAAIVQLSFIFGTVDAPRNLSPQNSLEQLTRQCTAQRAGPFRSWSMQAWTAWSM